MNERMKILIGYDGSDCARAALEDLRRAGLPAEADALLISVAELWMPPPPPSSYEVVEAATDLHSAAELQRRYARSSSAMKEAEELALEGGERLRKSFPGWRVEWCALLGSPARELMMKADEWNPDLIVLGSHGRSALGRLILGSVSQKVLSEARSTVRIARGLPKPEGTPARIVIGMDDSRDSKLGAVEVARREWPQGTVVELVTAVEPFHMYGPEPDAEVSRAREIQGEARQMLRAAGLNVVTLIEEGNPKRLLVEEAERFEADSIFVGARGHTFLERFLLGSVSSAVAARAHCSVEVTRPPAD